jgi:DNA invertase Pin-like site-specific DNA recombinase
MANIGYARVSTNGQEKNGYSLEDQKAKLREAGCNPKDIYTDTASGGKADRPELMRMLDRLHPGDVVIVYKLDRLARSLIDLLKIIDQIGKVNAHFRSLTESFIDTTTPAGTLITQIFGAMAQFERSLIHERTQAGINAARRAGRKLGPRYKLSDADRKHIFYLVREGKMTMSDCARTYHINQSNISRLVATELKKSRAVLPNYHLRTFRPTANPPMQLRQLANHNARHSTIRQADLYRPSD